MAAGLPLLKLAGLLVKTLSKPVATRLKVEAAKRPHVSQVIGQLGQVLHQMSSRFNVFASGYRFVGVKPLPAEEALSKGVNFLSESVVFTVAGTIIVLEYNRSETKNIEKAKKMLEKETQDKLVLEQRFQEIQDELEDLRNALPPHLQEYIKLRKRQRLEGSKPTPASGLNQQHKNADSYSWLKWFDYSPNKD